MGLRAKTKQRVKRLNEKRKRKEEARLKYQSFKEKGQNSKRGKLRNAKAKKNHVRPHSHPFGAWGNIGCAKCSIVEQQWRSEQDLKENRLRFAA